MLFEILSIITGIIKIVFYKTIYFKRFQFKSIPKITVDK